ncbi:MAG: phosphoribosylformylglycinamidine synthase I [Blastopirellula sp.]|nr:MAG: phosphoribosylformylglycinamidine synthase I [Blastopirellula sp.]
MATPKVLILRAPGTNCDHETAFAFEQAGAKADRVHLNRLLENPQLADEYQILCLPGGFSYGDDVAAGRIVGSLIRHHLSDTLKKFQADEKLILGICNGFQILIKSGVLLPDVDEGEMPATLTWNNSQKFEDRWVNLAANSSKCVFLDGIDEIYLPMAHAEGKFVAESAETLTALENAGQLALKYVNADGSSDNVEYPANPNGAQMNVAGVCDTTGRVFGLMPHPERFIDPTHHPRWTRGEGGTVGAGLKMFENAVNYFG